MRFHATLEAHGFTVTALGLGCEPLGGTDWGDVDLAKARAAVRCALDLGVMVFDTADVYGLGRSEEELSRALGAERHRATIVTKFGVRWVSSPDGGRASTYRDASRSYVAAALEASLRRLRLETIPVYLVHWPDPCTPPEDTIAELERARVQGKLLTYGLSNHPPSQVLRVAASHPLACVEGPFSLLDREPHEAWYRALGRVGVASLTYGALAQGVLAGGYSEDSVFSESDRRRRLARFTPAGWHQSEPILRVLRRVASEVGRPIAQVALRWLTANGAATVVIAGAKTPQQMAVNAGALDWSMSLAHYAALDRASVAEQGSLVCDRASQKE